MQEESKNYNAQQALGQKKAIASLLDIEDQYEDNEIWDPKHQNMRFSEIIHKKTKQQSKKTKRLYPYKSHQKSRYSPSSSPKNSINVTPVSFEEKIEEPSSQLQKYLSGNLGNTSRISSVQSSIKKQKQTEFWSSRINWTRNDEFMNNFTLANKRNNQSKRMSIDSLIGGKTNMNLSCQNFKENKKQIAVSHQYKYNFMQSFIKNQQELLAYKRESYNRIQNRKGNKSVIENLEDIYAIRSCLSKSQLSQDQSIQIMEKDIVHDRLKKSCQKLTAPSTKNPENKSFTDEKNLTVRKMLADLEMVKNKKIQIGIKKGQKQYANYNRQKLRRNNPKGVLEKILEIRVNEPVLSKQSERVVNVNINSEAQRNYERQMIFHRTSGLKKKIFRHKKDFHK